MTLLKEAVDFLLIKIKPLALAVGSIISATVRSFIPFDTGPAKGIKNGLLGFEGGTLSVGILNPENELATLFAGKSKVEQCHVGSAKVRGSGGRWGDTGTDGS